MRIMPLGRQDAFPREFGGAGFLVQYGSQLWLIDCPPGINLMLHQAGFTPMDITAVFITHLHNDHVGGLVEFTQFRSIGMKNGDIWRNAGYYDNIAREKIDIYIMGYDKEWLDLLDRLITLNNPNPWKECHNIVLLNVRENEKVRTEIIDEIKVEIKKGIHEPESCGIRIADKLAISGDTEYEQAFEDWLLADIELVFHEAGYGGAHCHPEDIAKIMSYEVPDQTKLFYHVPFAVLP